MAKYLQQHSESHRQARRFRELQRGAYAMMIGLTSSLAITFGVWEALLVFGIIVMLFGAKKIPDLARGLGGGIRNFKGELRAPPDDREDEADR